MEEFNKIRKHLPGIVFSITMLISISISWLIIINVENFYTDKQSGEMITLSEELDSKVYDACMDHFSKVLIIKSIVEQSSVTKQDYIDQFRGILKNPVIRDICLAPKCTIEDVYPRSHSDKLKGLHFLLDFPETIDIDEMIKTNTPQIIGPYDADAYEQAMAAVAPIFNIDTRGNRFFSGLACISVEFPKILENVDLSEIEKKGYAVKIWRRNRKTKEPVTILETMTSVDELQGTNVKNFSKKYFTSIIEYSFTPIKTYYHSRFFLQIAIVSSIFCILISLSAFYISKGISSEEKNKMLKMQAKLIENQEHTILSLSNLVEYRDSDTGNHVKRTSEYVVILARKAKEMGLYQQFLTEEFIDILRKAAPMHDVGKITISDTILNKPGKLTTDEFEKIKAHSIEGGRIVRDILGPVQTEEYTNIATQIATFHHEKWDGSGYPAGLSREQIPLSARIMAIADVFDALTTPRCYKEPFSFEKSLSIIQDEKGTHFDPQLVDVLIECQDEIRAVMIKFAE